MCSLGRRFLTSYYAAVLRSPSAYVICLVDDYGVIQGFTVSAFDTKAHFRAVSRWNLNMLISAIPALISRPGNLRGIWLRRKLMAAEPRGDAFISFDGARNEFMALDVSARSGPQAMVLMCRTLDVSRAMGVRELWIEVDEENERALKFHLRLGAENVRLVTRPDKKRRHIMIYRLKKV